MPSLKFLQRRKRSKVQPQLSTVSHVPQDSDVHVLHTTEDTVTVLSRQDPDPEPSISQSLDPLQGQKRILLLFALSLVVSEPLTSRSVFIKLLLLCVFFFFFSNDGPAFSNQPRTSTGFVKETPMKQTVSTENINTMESRSVMDQPPSLAFAGAWKLISRDQKSFEGFLKLQGESYIRRKAAAKASLKKTMTFEKGVFKSLVIIGGWFEIKESLQVGGPCVMDEVDGNSCLSNCYFKENNDFVVQKVSKEKGIGVWFLHTLNENGELEVTLTAKKGQDTASTKDIFVRQS